MTATLQRTRPEALSVKRKWSPIHFFAILAVPFFIHEVWTVVAWATDHPYQVTQYRHSGSLSWWGARGYEGLALCLGIGGVIWVVRDALRQRRLTLELSASIVCITSIWWMDYGGNLFAPGGWQASSYWVNVTNPCGHMPFMVNPDCGRSPDPWLFLVPLYTGVFPLTMLLARRLASWMRGRWPGLSWARTLGAIIGLGIAIDLALELPLIGIFKLWTFVGPSHAGINFGAFHYALAEVVAAGVWWGSLLCLYVYRNDKGQTIFERGAENVRAKWRPWLTLAAMYGCFMIPNWTVGTIPLAFNPLFHSGDWPTLPAHVVNGVCDAPGLAPTRYGPCPGSPGYRIPGRHSLPGESP